MKLLSSKLNTKMHRIELGDIKVDVMLKDIKNIHLSVYPPSGKVRISAPEHMNLDIIRVYAISKLSWIRKQQTKLNKQKRETPRLFLNRESHYFNGKRYLLKVIEHDAAPIVKLTHRYIEMYVRPDTTIIKKKILLDEWYRAQLKAKLPEIIANWQNTIQVHVNEFGIKKMKTKWGTCNPDAKRIWLNLELAKKPAECLEYIVVHEMTHLLERNHNTRFIALMDEFLPKWRFLKDELNRLPVSHVDWGY